MLNSYVGGLRKSSSLPYYTKGAVEATVFCGTKIMWNKTQVSSFEHIRIQLLYTEP